MHNVNALETHLRESREKLRLLRNQLAGAEQRFKQTRAFAEGQNVTTLTSAVRLAELTVEGIEEELVRLRTPRPVAIHSPRDVLASERQAVEQRMAYRQRQLDEATELERKRCGGMPERHVKIHLDNVLTGLRRGVARDNAKDQAILDDIARQFAAHDAEAAATAKGAA